jgi:hypothetical protein
MDESHKLDPWHLDEGPRPKSDKLRLNLNDIIWMENELVQTTKKKKLKRRAHDLKNQDAS